MRKIGERGLIMEIEKNLDEEIIKELTTKEVSEIKDTKKFCRIYKELTKDSKKNITPSEFYNFIVNQLGGSF